MPHIIMEYTKSLGEHVNMNDLVQAMHNTLADQGVDAGRIKTRAIPLDHVVAGDLGLGGLMAHTTLLLLEGRDIAIKQQYGNAIHTIMKVYIEPLAPECKLTLEVRDMEKETYIL